MTEWETVDAAGQDAVGWSMVADYAKRRYETARMFIADKLSAQNSRGIDVEVNGAIVGSVSCGMATDKPDVVDDEAFLAYVIENHPDALRVDSRWKELFLKRLVKTPGKRFTADTEEDVTWFIDKATGEKVPGVELVRSRPSWKVTKDPEARERMNQLLSTVQPTLEGLKALPPEPEPIDRFTQDRIAAGLQDD